MKRVNFFAVMLFAITTLFFISCNSSGDKNGNTADSTKTDSNTTATTPVTPVNTIVTTPQNMLVVTHKVADYAKWKPMYDGHDTARVSHGIHNYVIGRGLTDTNMVMVAMKIDDVEKAKAFGNEPSLKKAMKAGGVIGTPTMSMYTSVWQDTATISTTIRSRASFTVKDWDAWQKSFEASTQERKDNGIVTRVYGHDISDTKKVIVVTALTDTAKAFAYYKSDVMKKRMQEGGIVGGIQRFLYTIVQKY